jgi:alpha-D-ribose 1-methylphosphonate 5-triphosphate diphosphatase
MAPTVLTNARIVLSNDEIRGSVVIDGDRIVDVSPRHYAAGFDLRGSILSPGVIDIHTDYLERELAPRPSARFPLDMALHVMDLRALGCGLTTIVSAARISSEKDGPVGSWRGDGLALARNVEALLPQLRANHLIHLRWSPQCEAPEEILVELLKLKNIGNLVFNDDMPGQRQFRDVEGLIQQYALRNNVSIEQSRAHMQERIERAGAVNNRLQVRDFLKGQIPLGSHDDTTVEHVVEAYEADASLCEMPCSIEAARKARELGMMICMGAPNYYRGGSHCGNLSCHDALDEGLVDILCSDYHFPSLLACALRMAENGMPLWSAMNLLTLNPARHLRIDEEVGNIELGKRADLIAFRPRNGYAEVSHVWVRGREMLHVGDTGTSASASSMVGSRVEDLTAAN